LIYDPVSQVIPFEFCPTSPRRVILVKGVVLADFPVRRVSKGGGKMLRLYIYLGTDRLNTGGLKEKLE
jgi:hypothetical protein